MPRVHEDFHDRDDDWRNHKAPHKAVAPSAEWHAPGQERACAGKIAHRSRRDAGMHQARTLAKYGCATRVYRCPTCRKWHLTLQLERTPLPPSTR